MNTPFDIKRLQFQRPAWKHSSFDQVQDLEDSFSLPQHFVETGDDQFHSSAASLPARFEPGFDFNSSTASLPEFVDDNLDSEVGPYDVLCGRDKHSFRNVGNRRFRVTVSLFIGRYVEAETKSEKSRVIAAVVETVHANGGRFLKWSSKRQEWVPLDSKHIREKVGHALRDTAVAKMGPSAAASNHKSKLSGSIPPCARPRSGSNPSPHHDESELFRSPDQGLRSVRTQIDSSLRDSVSSLHRSLRAGLQRTPEAIREVISLAHIEEDIGELCLRTSFRRGITPPGRDDSAGVAESGDNDNDNQFLDAEEFEKIVADVKANPTSRVLWEGLPVEST